MIRDGLRDALESLSPNALRSVAHTARTSAREALAAGDADRAAFWSGLLQLALRERTRRYTSATDRVQEG